uniref:Uncharacterized protein n=1 Tax=Opuntia streptacantha TaxID=393608 RepID=A0A7C8ZVZ4_OPUST
MGRTLTMQVPDGGSGGRWTMWWSRWWSPVARMRRPAGGSAPPKTEEGDPSSVVGKREREGGLRQVVNAGCGGKASLKAQHRWNCRRGQGSLVYSGRASKQGRRGCQVTQRKGAKGVFRESA